MAKVRQIDPRDYVEPGTSFQKTIGYILFFMSTGLAIVVAIVGTFGIALIPLAIGLAFYYYRVRIALAQLRGSALKVGPKQFPEIYDAVAELADAMDMDPPDVYIVESEQQNAFATKIGAKKNIVLFDRIVDASMELNNPDLLRFIIGHELAHHALGHTGLIRSQVSLLYKPLSRSDEFSCDAVGAALVGEQAGKDALTLLLIGPRLLGKINRASLDRQALAVEEDRYTRRAEKQLHYPLLLHRIARMIPDEDEDLPPSRPSKPSKSSKSDNRYDADDYEDDDGR